MKSVILVSIIVSVQAGNIWLKDLISPKGWDVGYGITLKINENVKGRNLPMMERLSLDVNLGELVGVSVNKGKSDNVQLDFFVKKNVGNSEARSRKNGGGGGGGGRYVFPLLIGYKFAIIIGGAFAVLKLLALKGIFLAKMALLISLYLLTKHKTRSSEIIEIEQQHTPYHLAKEPIGHYGYYHHGGGYGEHAQPSNLYPDVAYAASAAGVTAAGTAESPAGYPGNQDDSSNGIPLGLGRNGKEFKRRRDAYIKRKKGDNVSDSSVVVNT